MRRDPLAWSQSNSDIVKAKAKPSNVTTGIGGLPTIDAKIVCNKSSIATTRKVMMENTDLILLSPSIGMDSSDGSKRVLISSPFDSKAVSLQA